MATEEPRSDFYQQLFEAVSDAIFVYDPADGVVVDANPAAARLTGYEIDDLEGSSVSKFSAGTPEEVEQAALRIVDAAADSDQQFQWPVVRADGENRLAEVSLHRTTINGDDRALALLRDVTDRERDRAEQETARQQLSLLTEVNPSVLWLFSADWEECLFINDAYEEIWGRSVDALRADPTDFMQAVHPDDRDRIEEIMEQLANGSRVELQYRVNEGEGYTRWVWTEGIPIFDADGELQQFVGFNRDITDIKRLETRLTEQTAALSTLTDNVPLVLFELDDEGTFIQSRGRGLEELGLASDQLVGESLFELYSEQPAILDAYRRALDGEEVSQTAEVEGVVYDSWYQPQFAPDGSVTGVIGAAISVTDRERLEQELQANDQALRDLHTRAARSDLTMDERIRTMLDIGRERLNLPYGFLTRIEDGTQHIVEAVGTHEDLQPGGSAPLSEAYCRRTIETDGLLGVADAPEAGWESDPAYERFGLNCYIGGKLVIDGELYGTVCFAGSTARDQEFSTFERSLVELLLQWFAYELEREQREETLHETNAELAAVLDTSPVAIIQFDDETTVEQWNHRAETMFQIPREEAIGEPLQIIPAEGRPDFDAMRERLMAGESVRNYETTRQRADGAERVVSINAEPTRDSEGIPTGGIVAVTDITEQKQQQQRADALRSATQSLVGVDTEVEVGEIAVETIKTALGFPVCAMWLLDEAEDLLRPIAETEQAVELVGPAPTIDRGEGLFWRALATGTIEQYDDTHDEAAILNPDTPLRSEIVVPIGEHGVVAVSSTEPNAFSEVDIAVLETLTGSLTAALNSVADSQALRRRDRELERQNEQLDEFADVIAHDLRGPLTAARGFFEIALETHDDDHFKQVEHAHARMELLIDDLLTMARQGQSIGEREPIDLDVLARSVWADVPDAATLEITASLPEVVGDKHRLEEVFSNLFRNAVDHVGSGVTVRVGPLADDGFYIEDDGPGIPAGKRPHIFDYGYTTNPHGTGIGLAVVEGIITAHGWTVTVTEGSDGGARFEVRTAHD